MSYSITDYHAKYYANELSKKCSSDSLEKLAATFIDAQVDMNPHQVDAALFAFKSPLSRGAILADEVGLGKTIEAGLILSQQWAERKRKILIITPSNLRKQWKQELLEKFFLPSTILEAKNFKAEIKAGKANPFIREDIVLCSYHFARNKAEYIKAIQWDLIVIDEAHRLRNVYKSSNKIAKEIRQAIGGKGILLLTATPLQNSLLELFGLVSFIDPHIFGDLKSFKMQFARLTGEENFHDLKARIAPICQRTLRKQVKEYINYKKRICHTQPFEPTEDEQELYNLVSEYLQRPNLQALPNSQRSLLTLVLRKLLASSTFAIAGALNTMAKRLQKKINDSRIVESLADIEKDFEGFDEELDEWGEDEQEVITVSEKDAIQREIDELNVFFELAMSITNNAKGEALLTALEIGFKKARELGGQEKVIIFTESRRTQNYLLELLNNNGFKEKIVLFNGTNTDQESKNIYNLWLATNSKTDKVSGSKTADMRSALVDCFKNDAQIMLATEAAAEGINLQFCSLVVNYDMPWNPQRIEQRIGRCHRYGQKFDVVVINFLNTTNAADKRVYELLSEKFRLFDGVFGASDEVLGKIESGIDFEKRIVEILQKCRTQEEIEESFNKLQKDMEETIDETVTRAKSSIFENFEEDVINKLRIDKRKTDEYKNQYEKWLWSITEHTLQNHADFSKDKYEFNLKSNPTRDREIRLGIYRFEKNVEDAHTYRLGHPLAKFVLESSLSNNLSSVLLEFSLSKNISDLNQYKGRSGVLQIIKLRIETLEVEDHIIATGLTENGEPISTEIAKKFFLISAKIIKQENILDKKQIEPLIEKEIEVILGDVAKRNNTYFDDEMDKLDKWAEDVKNSLEIELKELGKLIKEKQKEARKFIDLEKKLEAQKEIKNLEKRRNDKRRNLFDAQDKIDEKKEDLITDIEKRLKQKINKEELFFVKWRLV